MRYSIAPCTYFGTCGGCRSRDIPYLQQLKSKEKVVRASFEGIPACRIRSIRPSPAIEFYRNKMEYACGVWDDELVLGLREYQKYYRVLDLKECFLQSALSMDILATIRRAAERFGLKPFHRKHLTGTLRYVVVREGKKTGQCMVHLITSPLQEDRIPLLLDQIQDAHPEITTLIWSTTDTRSDVACGQEVRQTRGPGYIEDRIGTLRFRISPYSFFQTNTFGAQVLYEMIKKYAGRTKADLLLDLYCGTGGIGLYIASLFKKVIGIELNPSSVEDAKTNAQLNRIAHARFICSNIRDIHTLRLELPFPRMLAIVDPPRAGMDQNLHAFLASHKPASLVYVSCNPAALNRDLQRLTQYYKITGIQPIDLFPHTPHIETVVMLRVIRH